MTINRTINYSAVDGQKESALPDGVQSTSQQSVNSRKAKMGSGKTTIPEQSIKQIDNYYTKVNGQWSDKIPSITITDPNQKLDPVSVVYVQSQQVINPTDKKDEKQKDLFGTVDYTVKYQAPNGISLPDGTKNPDTIQVTVSRTKTVDTKDSSKVKYGHWTGNLEKDYQIPQIAGYTSYVNGKKATVIKSGKDSIIKIDSDSIDVPKGSTITITYQPSEDYNKNVDLKLQGNWGYLDNLEIKNNSIHVSGWNATNESREGQYHYIFVLANGKEIGRAAIDLSSDQSSRADIPGVHNVWNASHSGFNVTIPLDLDNLRVGDQITIMSRWTSDKDGSSVDLPFDDKSYKVPVGQNEANLDNFEMNGNNGVVVSGWNATNQSLDYKYHWVILYDRTTGREVSRQQVKIGDGGVERQDVANAYPTIFNANTSGFSTYFSLGNVNLTDNLQLISRYTNDPAGNGAQTVDYWFPAKQFMSKQAASAASLDDISYTGNGLHVSGWFASDNTSAMKNLFLILWDDTAKTQAASKLVDNVSRSDVARAYPRISNSGNSGFDTYFNGISLVPGHQYTLVARYSTSSEGNGGNGASTDCWFTNKKYTFNLNRTNAGHFDGYTINDGKLNVSGWHANDMSAIENNHWLILLDSSNGNREVQRIQINYVARPDVANAYRGIITAGNSGFNGQFDLSKLQAGHTYTLVSRYAVDPNNAAQYTDYWFNNAFTLNQQAFNIESFTPNIEKTASKDEKTANNQLTSIHVTGWMISDYSMQQPNAYLILLNDKGQELGRQKVERTDRPDVDRVYPSVANSDKSGFATDIKLNKLIDLTKNSTENLHLVLRFTDGKDGNPTKTDKAVDQISKNYIIELKEK